MKDWRTRLFEQWNAEWIKQFIVHLTVDPELFDQVFAAFYNEDGRIAHRSGFILGNVFRKSPELLIPRIEQLLEQMPAPKHEWYRWHVLWYLSHSKFPEEFDGAIADYAFTELGKSYNKPAIKNCSMRLLENICKRNPELFPEYKLYLENIIEHERPTLVAKAKKQLAFFEKSNK